MFSKNDPERAASFTEQYYEWQFVRIPGGPAKQLIAKDKGDVVGFGALLPFKIKKGGGIETVYEGVEFVVAPTHRRRGIFTGLALKLYEEIGQSGSFAFASSMSFRTFQEKLDHKFIGYFPYWIGIRDIGRLLRKKIGPFALLAKPLIKRFELKKSVPPDKNISITPVKEFDEAWDAVENWRYDKKVSFHKSRQYLNWRYIRHPSNRYDVFGAFANDQPAGFIVLREFNLVDIGYVSMDAFGELLNSAIDYFNKKSILLCHAYLCLDGPARDMLKRRGFIRANALQHGLLNKYCYPRQRMLVRGRDLDHCTYKNCMLTMGDIDSKL